MWPFTHFFTVVAVVDEETHAVKVSVEKQEEGEKEKLKEKPLIAFIFVEEENFTSFYESLQPFSLRLFQVVNLIYSFLHIPYFCSSRSLKGCLKVMT